MKDKNLKRNLEQERVELLLRMKKATPDQLLKNIEKVMALNNTLPIADIKISNVGACDAHS